MYVSFSVQTIYSVVNARIIAVVVNLCR